MQTQESKNFILTGIDHSNKRVKRKVVAVSKKVAIQAAKRSKILRTISHIKEIKND